MNRPAVAALALCAAVAPVFAQATKPNGQPSFEDLTRDMEAVPGLMTFYRYKSADPTRDTTKLLCVVPRSLLKQDLLLAVNFTRGNMAGFQYQDGLVRWEQVGRQLALVAPDTSFVDKPGNPINDAVRRTYRPSYVFAVPILGTTPAGDPLVDLSEALFSPSPLVPLPTGGQVRRDISRLAAVKAFKHNVLVDVDYALRAGNGGSTVGVSFAFRDLPSLGGSDAYRPRLADERVGYFITTQQDWTTRYDQREQINRCVNRWDLRKIDPSLELSPPVKPITFVIDKGVPYQWRRYVADGALEWNKAFEKIGIINAVVVQQQTDDNEFADVDPADADYNFIQWTVRNKTLAVGPSRADPRTGQILDADIVVDDSWIRFFNRSSETFSAKAVATLLGPGTAAFLEKNPEFLPPGVSADDLKEELHGTNLMRDAAEPVSDSPLRPSRRSDQCEFAFGLVQQLSLAQGMAAAAKTSGMPKVSDQIIGNALKWVVAHEVGHTLGLRHNFKASSWLSLDEIKKRRDAGEPFVASVMDYTPLAFFADDDLAKVKSFNSNGVGPYDDWAIQYGYAQPKDGQSVSDMLKSITSQSAKREYAYATDEDTDGLSSPDPLSNRYDMSDSPLAWAKAQIDLTNKLLANVQDWGAKPDEPNEYLRQTFLQLMNERSRNLAYVARLVGGQYFSRSRRSDPNAPTPLTPVDPKLQRDALKLIGETVFSADFYRIDQALLDRLPPTRWWDNNGDFPQPRTDFAYTDFVQRQFEVTLMALAGPQTLQRVYDAEVRSQAADKMTSAEMIRSLRDILWTELTTEPANQPSDATPLIAPERRNMQDTHLQYLIATAEAPVELKLSPDLKNQARFALRELSGSIKACLDKRGDALDFASKAHLTEAHSRIERTLEKPITDPRGSDRLIQLKQDAATAQ